MRQYIGRLLHTDTVLNGLGVTKQSLYAGDADTPAERPYVVLRWGDTSPGVGRDFRVDARDLTIWVHDKENDYTRIDAIIYRIRQLFDAVAGVRTETGYITQIEWTTNSGDLADDTTRTIVRTTTYAIVASGQ